MEALGDPTKLAPLLAGPAGAIVALLLFIAYLLKELATARSDIKLWQQKYENMRDSRDDFRFIAGDAVRTAKRSIQTHVAAHSKETRE